MIGKLRGVLSGAPLILKFLAIAVPLTLLATVATFALNQNSRYLGQIADLDDRIAKLAEIEASVLSGPVWNFNQAQIDLIISSVINNLDVTSIAVLDDRGTVLGSIETSQESTSRQYPASAAITWRDGDSERNIGRLDLTYSRERLNAAARQQLQSAVLVTTLLTMAVVVSALLALNVTVLRPLHRFRSAIDQANETNAYVPIDWHTGDEIGRVAGAYNDLQHRQKQDEAELKNVHDNLENLVEERTEELRSTVEKLQAREIELIRARDDTQQMLTRLQKTQDRLVQSEKMASLGQLTAGIAHEIKNPLNFVNNFSSLSVELLDELAELMGTDNPEGKEEADELLETVAENLRKIREHGNRADTIVRNMLRHSRSGPSEPQTADLNAIIDEALKLSFHSSRAELEDFNIEMITNYGEGIEPIQCYAQDISRVFINIFSNGMYATHAHAKETPGYAPRIEVRTIDSDDSVLVEIADNGPGIPPEVTSEIFTPFYTTKPAGEGTGLGLSISYDIVAVQHGGEISVDDAPGQGAKFIIRLPKVLPDEATREGTEA